MNREERMKALAVLAECVQDVIRGGWMSRVDLDELSDTWHSGEYRVRWHDDGTASLLDQGSDSNELLRFQVEVTVSAVSANAPLASAAAPCPWSYIPAGWFVQPSPGAPWWEIISTTRQGAVQAVGMRTGNKRGIWMRTPDQKVTACPGSARGPMQDALDALPPFEILDDRLEEF